MWGTYLLIFIQIETQFCFFMERDIDKDFLHNFIEILFQKYTLLCILRDYCTLFCLKSYPGLFSISHFLTKSFLQQQAIHRI